eukprot:jgi/Chrpa1/24638/Chrysochromulina_OHIO_Genome00027752-RA
MAVELMAEAAMAVEMVVVTAVETAMGMSVKAVVTVVETAAVTAVETAAGMAGMAMAETAMAEPGMIA